MPDLAWLNAVLTDQPDPNAVRRMCIGLQSWWRGSGQYRPSLARCMGLPENPELARIALRDHFLHAAADTFAEAQPWVRARCLRDAAIQFKARKWPLWWNLPAVPEHATPLERLLWNAARAGGGQFPKSVRRYAQILGE